ncbi:ATP-grasp domain-containing protein [Romboutsia timonensis]|uniref:ATP-grasp domain-containing protein n=1 Tax=Romboutsia timonensis TaxID=1776391 RepID=UPI002A81ABE1|nr:ATP-grasp domain-containing protein [Romboutsia timonensis]MDY3959640.1 ATP-grasp domain-containing protein [Romboutsia timonensis]
MKNINVLILSAGRRVELVNCFKDARDSLGIKGNVVACDLSNTAPAIYHADKNYLVSRILDDNYIPEIVDICKKEDIHLIVPTIDTELYKLAEAREYIESNTSAKVLVSDMSVVKICRDKYNTQAFFEENGFNMPRLIDEEVIKNKDYKFPLFIKPLNGSSSINTFKVNNEKELEFFLEYVPEPIVQDFMEGEEYTIDAFVDFEHNPITIVPRQRLATRGGEVLKGLVKKDREIIETIKNVIKVLKPIGHITIQCMKTNEGIKFIEINPRFGGGAPISIKAGANSPMNLYRLLLGEKLEYSEEYEDGLLASRHDWAVFINSRGEQV